MTSEILEKSHCITCNEVTKCSGHNPRSESVLFCEEFDNFVSQPHIPRSTEMEIFPKDGDLCINCDNNKSCPPKSNSLATWYCEEYA